ncbi:hypothetical protein D8B26_003098 [Coccidioides posadasii str. Silveira]|uniref:uncharacterized protein n=1 Tax=Coccidioides posadasii (strain RMSCC 757 / Silveira) TaxID=443226 RepID=UPI001BEE97CD|nr:hypothetical protein D8B26_003098 [Coccidioides posadasii str. Silveira]
MCSDGYVVNARDYVVCGDWCPVEEPNDEIGIVNAAGEQQGKKVHRKIVVDEFENMS